MEEKKLTRREREKLGHRQEMLAAALELFAQKGYHNVSMHEIAGKAEFAIGTLYKFFRNKEDLYKALIVNMAEKYHRILKEALEGTDDVPAVLKKYVASKAEFFADNIDTLRLYFAETHGASFNIEAGLDRDIREQYEDLLKKLESVFKKGIRREVFSKLDPHYMAVALEGISNAFLFRWLENPKRHSYHSNVQKIMDMFLGGVLNKGL